MKLRIRATDGTNKNKNKSRKGYQYLIKLNPVQEPGKNLDIWADKQQVHIPTSKLNCQWLIATPSYGTYM